MATKEELEKIKRRSAAYWKKRSKELEEASFNRGMRTYRDIEEAFNQAQRSIDKEIEKWYHRIAENNDLTLDGARKLLRANELEEFKWDVKEYIKAGKENAVNQSWMKELENASGRYHISRLEALKIETQQALELAFGNEVDAIDKMARRTIDEDYLKTCYELQKGIGVGWPVGTIDNRTLDKIVTKPWAADGANFSDRIWTNKTKMVDTLHQNLTRACILGQAPDKAIAALTQFVDKSISNAKRAAATLVQTEQAYFHAKAQQEAYTAIGVEEFEVVATLDSHTSEICQEMDGEHFPMSQYEIGTTVPPFHPRCRSVTAPYFEDDFGVSGQRTARRSDEESTYYVPDNMTYKEWKESFVEGHTEDLKPAVPEEFQNAFNDQVDLLKQYGNVTNIMLKGSSDDLMKWSESQKITNLDEKSILKELSKDAKGWETILASQTEKKMQPFVNQLLDVATDEELGALNLWTSETYANINKYLRYGVNVDEISKKAAHDIEAVLNKVQTTEEIIVHRGTGTKHIFEKMIGDWKTDPTVLIGQEFSDLGFTATSPLVEGGFSGVGATQCELFIKVPVGTHGAYIAQEAHNELEREFLLQRGYSYRIIDAEYRSNPLFSDEQDLKVWCEVILDE